MLKKITARNNVQVFGKGSQPMLFAHGFGCDQNMWRFITPEFQADYRVILFDYVGCGKSDVRSYDPKRYASLAGYAQDVLDVCEEMDLTDIIFVGHSVSSMVGVLAANQQPQRFSRLIMLGPSPCYINDGVYIGGFEREDIQGLLETMERNFLGWAQFLAPVVMKNSERPELARELEESFCSTDPDIMRRFAEATFYADNRADLSKVTVPSLILQCQEDTIAPLCVGTYLHQELAGSTLRVMDATGHCPHMSHPEETVRLMRDYLANSASGQPAGPENFLSASAATPSPHVG